MIRIDKAYFIPHSRCVNIVYSVKHVSALSYFCRLPTSFEESPLRLPPGRDAAVAERFGDMDAAHSLGAVEVGEGAGCAQHPVPAAGTEPHAPGRFGEHLKKRRYDMRLWQKDVALRLGLNASTLGNWEKGKTTPAVRFMPRIIEFLGDYPVPVPRTLQERLIAK